MRIVYIARHDSGDNDDEGSISFALEKLGHEVVKIHQMRRHRPLTQFRAIQGDFALCHSWGDFHDIVNLRIPLVFWYFDLVESDDPLLITRSKRRIAWMAEITKWAKLGFCTDGDWVANSRSPNLVHLMQGMDERVAGFQQPNRDPATCPPILFTGMANHGTSRESHIAELQERYGDRFNCVGPDGRQDRIHGKELAYLFASTKIVIAPDGPQTDRYWSNRVYNTIGLGGFLLHPYCEGLAKQYEPGKELIYYHNRNHLYELIDNYLELPASRDMVRQAGMDKTLSHHLYRHRCEELIRVVKERLNK